MIAELIIGAAILMAIPAGTAAYFWLNYPGNLWIIAGLLGAGISVVIAPALWELLDMIRYMLEGKNG